MPKIVHVVDVFASTERHERAQSTWEKVYELGVIPIHVKTKDLRRNSTIRGDTLIRPFLKDVLKKGTCDADMVIWSNDDIALDPRIVELTERLCSKNGAFSMRRNEPGHIGRDLFAFDVEWLERNWSKIPDFVQGAPAFDLVLAALIRKTHGNISTIDNLQEDLEPSDAKERYALHEPHPSCWVNSIDSRMINAYNLSLARYWCRTNMPSLHL